MIPLQDEIDLLSVVGSVKGDVQIDAGRLLQLGEYVVIRAPASGRRAGGRNSRIRALRMPLSYQYWRGAFTSRLVGLA